jgi:hypothetical protein
MVSKKVQNERYIKHICLPMVLRYDALASFHDTNAGGGHLGVDKVLSGHPSRAMISLIMIVATSDASCVFLGKASTHFVNESAIRKRYK